VLSYQVDVVLMFKVCIQDHSPCQVDALTQAVTVGSHAKRESGI
jgi:hypothetical protein